MKITNQKILVLFFALVVSLMFVACKAVQNDNVEDDNSGENSEWKNVEFVPTMIIGLGKFGFSGGTPMWGDEDAQEISEKYKITINVPSKWDNFSSNLLIESYGGDGISKIECWDFLIETDLNYILNENIFESVDKYNPPGYRGDFIRTKEGVTANGYNYMTKIFEGQSVTFIQINKQYLAKIDLFLKDNETDRQLTEHILNSIIIDTK